MFLTIVDDFTRVTWTHLMKSKTNSYALMIQFLNFINTQFHVKVQRIRTNNVPDLVEGEIKQMFIQTIENQRSCSRTPQQNVVERKHRHLLETARSLLLQSKLPLRYWGILGYIGVSVY